MMARLGDVCEILNGYAFKSANYTDKGVRIIRISNVKKGYIEDNTPAFYPFDDINVAKYELLEGDLLLSLTGNVGRVGCLDEKFLPAVLNQRVACIRIKDSTALDKSFLFNLLNSDSFEQKCILSSKGVAQKNMSTEWLKNYKIFLPPLDKQRHIAAVLDKVSDLIAKRCWQLDKLDELVKSRFVEMFGDPVANPKKWNTLSFKEAGVRLSDGPFGSNLKSEHYTTEGVRVIRLGNIGVGQFVDNDKTYISKQHYEKLRKYICKAGEIVIGTLGEPNLRACLVPQNIEYAINKADCVHYIPNSKILNTNFVCHYINCPETLLLASGMVHGQTRSRISSGQLAEIPIFIPPLDLQNQFAAFVEQTDKSKLAVQKSLDKLELLKKALMQKYFG